MSEEQIRHINGEHEEVEFERQDISPKAVLAFLVGLVIAGFLIHLGLSGMYNFLNGYESRNQPRQSPLVNLGDVDTRRVTDADVQKFPEPRLESDERTEINDFRLREEQLLNSYGWVDEKSGVVRIPIDHAMDLIVERGLPTRPQSGTVPLSTVNMVNQATAKADTSQKSQPKAPNR